MRIWKTLFTKTRYFNTRKTFPIWMFVVMASGKCVLHIYFTFLQEFYPPHIRKYLIFFFAYYMSRCPTNNFPLSILSKWLSKYISTIVSFKNATRKRYVYIDIGWPWIWNHCLYFGIWKDDCTKMIVLPSLQLATRLNSQNTNESEFINERCHINMFMNIGISNWHNWNFDFT